MKELSQLFSNNRSWAREMCNRDPAYFQKLAAQQAPDYLWIGCSDSRVPANTILGLEPGEVFVHRNVANLVKPEDTNCLSVMQFAIDTIKVRHIIVCGHYGCGGVRAAMCEHLHGLSRKWLEDIRAIAQRHAPLLSPQKSEAPRLDLLCELNVIEQVMNVCNTEVVRDAWLRGRALTVHGWIYGLADGLLRDLGISVSAPDQLAPSYRDALASISRKESLLHH
jgi:carbonic anhydrase